MIKNIVFDMGGVLVGFDQQRCIDRFCRLGAHKVAKYVEEHRTEDLFAAIETGRMSTEEFCREAQRIGSFTAHEQQIIDAWNALLTPMTANKLQKLLELKKRHRLFLLSNTNEMHWLHCKHHLIGNEQHPIDEIFERCFLSYRMHMVKPNVEIYQAVTEACNLQPDETLFIDDSAENLTGAEKAGWHTFHEAEGHRWTTLLQP